MADSQKTVEQIAAAAKQNAAFYVPEIPPEIDSARHLLERYSGITLENAEAHIREIRDKAWAVFPYGAIGSFRFLDINPTLQDPLFQAVVERLKAPGSGEVFLDVGCCLGHVIRQLIAQGVPSERLYGIDLQARFLDFGYDLFRDRDSTRATFVAGDMLWDKDPGLEGLSGKVDIIYASAFFHLFERENQVKVAKRMIKFLKPDIETAMIFGYNGGPKIPGWEKYVLNEEAWGRMWDEVGEATGTSWRTEMNVESNDEEIKVRFALYQVA
ncbi:S-adenosyl-L-methionine-dependent methyltransferase [Nemania sp. FL0031]|nr:S-adenosyl-L-methionine-dependent methyltransferase [Nemania sp. FL0031]